jgi:hypothetical protein
VQLLHLGDALVILSLALLQLPLEVDIFCEEQAFFIFQILVGAAALLLWLDVDG